MGLLSRDVTLVRCMSMSSGALGKAVGLIYGLCSSTLSMGIHPVYCGWVPVRAVRSSMRRQSSTLTTSHACMTRLLPSPNNHSMQIEWE